MYSVVKTIRAAHNYANPLLDLKRFEEAKSVLREMMPVARRVNGDGCDTTLRARWCYAWALYEDPAATRDDLREAVTTLEDAGRTARRVFGGAHPLTGDIDTSLRISRAVLRDREAGKRVVFRVEGTPSGSA